MAPTRSPQNTTESEVNRPPDGGPPSLLVQVLVATRMLGIGRTKVYELVGEGELELVHNRVPGADPGPRRRPVADPREGKGCAARTTRLSLDPPTDLDDGDAGG